MLSVQFGGAARTVTGSQYFFEYTATNGSKFCFCLDSGMFQVGGAANLFKVNSHLIFDPRKLDCVVLSHAHLDHCGRLPYLVKRGFGGKIYSTPATMQIAEVVMLDSARLSTSTENNPDYYFPVKGLKKIDLQDASEKFSANKIAPKITVGNGGSHQKLGQENFGLYNTQDVELTVSRFKTFEYHEKFKIHPEIEVEFYDAGHILGSAFVVVNFLVAGKKIVFSGDLGNINKPIIEDPEKPKGIAGISHIFVETTYGNRSHGELNPKTKLLQVAKKALNKDGKLFIPAFSVERAQEIIYFLVELMREGKISKVPIFLDSPMAEKILKITLEHPELYDKNLAEKVKNKAHPLIYSQIKILQTADDSKSINGYQDSAIVIAGSGMLNGGRIVKHLRFHVQNPSNTFLLVGYQAVGTLGRKILDGAKLIQVEDVELEVNAKIELITEFSAHADKDILNQWIGDLVLTDEGVKTVFLMHGEKEASTAFGQQIERFYPKQVKSYWPYFGEKVELF